MGRKRAKKSKSSTKKKPCQDITNCNAAESSGEENNGELLNCNNVAESNDGLLESEMKVLFINCQTVHHSTACLVMSMMKLYESVQVFAYHKSMNGYFTLPTE